MNEGELILVGGALLASGVAASLLADRLRVPGLVLFLAVGMVLGSDVAGLVEFNDYELAQTVGIVALVLILFEGGLTAGLPEIRPVLPAAISLATVGTIVTAIVAGFAAYLLFDFTLLEGLLLASTLSATDGAAIFSLLRGSTLRRRLARTLEGESGMNDPVAVLLVIGFIEWIESPDFGLAEMAGLMALEIAIGAIVGVAVGVLAVKALQRARLATAGLYPVASLAVAALAYGVAEFVHGSGFLAVYLAGLALGTGNIPAKQTVTIFHQGLAWVAQLSMFLALGLLVFPGAFGDVALEGIVLAFVIVFVARPAGVVLSTIGFGYTAAEKVMLGWAGLKGAVPVVLATFPVIDGVQDSLEFFNLVFFAVLLSTLLQGATFEPLARRLGVTTTEPALPRPLTEAGTIRRLGAEVLEYPVAPDDAAAGARVRDLGLPRDAVVNVIVRGDQAIPPRGSTRLRPGDRVHVLLRQESANEVRELAERWRHGPIGRPPRPKRRPESRAAILTVRRWNEERDGDPSRPQTIAGQPIVEQLRVRRDEPGGLFVLADGRYAITGPLLAVGGRLDLSRWARRAMDRAPSDERMWLQTVVGALASDLPD